MPAPKLFNKIVIGIKTETTQNTPATLVATDFLLAEGVEITPVGEQIARNYRRNSLDKIGHVIGKKNYDVKFKIEIKGSGTRGTAYAPLGAALQACAFVETVNAATSVVYSRSSSQVSANFFTLGKSCTIEIYRDGHKHVIAGCAGNGKITASKSGEIVYLECDFKGIYLDPTDAAAPTQTYSAILPPKFENATISIEGVAHTLSKFDLDFGNVTTLKEDASASSGVGGFMVTDWAPKGSCDPEAVPLSTDTIIADFMAGTIAAGSISIGSTSGNIVAIALAAMQSTGAPYTDKNGILTHNLGFDVLQSTGDDSIIITLT